MLATHLSDNHIWGIDPNAKTGAALVEVPGVNSTQSIVELADDVLLFTAGNLSPSMLAVPGSWGVWKVDLSGTTNTGQAPVPEKVSNCPGAARMDGIAVWDGSRVLVSDSEGSKVHIIDFTTGACEVAIDRAESG
ncbi:hypothetical protein IMZ48_29345 [Candidatus Bathyarchaeota archaeon]|nr:hypothetical protein [Candidatus Bathyarchaeota archaeon]